jgi:hypothetical protein
MTWRAWARSRTGCVRGWQAVAALVELLWTLVIVTVQVCALLPTVYRARGERGTSSLRDASAHPTLPPNPGP